jgi:hypothetical protein
MRRWRHGMLVISGTALTAGVTFAQVGGGPGPDDFSPGGISAGIASEPERVPWTTQPAPQMQFTNPVTLIPERAAPEGVDSRTGQPLSTTEPATGNTPSPSTRGR